LADAAQERDVYSLPLKENVALRTQRYVGRIEGYKHLALTVPEQNK